VYDVGTVINAKTAGSQLRGGIVMGIGMALTEETLVDARNGRIVNPSLAGYQSRCSPTSRRSTSTGRTGPDHAAGLIGAGEVGIIDAAIANAVHRATGKRVRNLPITPNELL
jgi:xanthine dehydrogenase YagR molybdenum-binding subunit